MELLFFSFHLLVLWKRAVGYISLTVIEQSHCHQGSVKKKFFHIRLQPFYY